MGSTFDVQENFVGGISRVIFSTSGMFSRVLKKKFFVHHGRYRMAGLFVFIGSRMRLEDFFFFAHHVSAPRVSQSLWVVHAFGITHGAQRISHTR